MFLKKLHFKKKGVFVFLFWMNKCVHLACESYNITFSSIENKLKMNSPKNKTIIDMIKGDKPTGHFWACTAPRRGGVSWPHQTQWGPPPALREGAPWPAGLAPPSWSAGSCTAEGQCDMRRGWESVWTSYSELSVEVFLLLRESFLIYFLAMLSIFCFFFRRGREEEDVPTREEVDCETCWETCWL